MRAIFIIGLIFALFSARANNTDVIVIAHTIMIQDRASPVQTFMDPLPWLTPAKQAALCTVLHCDGAVPVMAENIRVAQPVSGYTTGLINRHTGGEWLISFPAPPEYVACSAVVDGAVGMNKGDTSTGAIFRDPATGENWLGSYNQILLHRPERHWIDARFLLKYV
jgi:hypothetical protein